jgi:hypothetical protein
MGPLYKMGFFGEQTSFVFAFVIGIAFGFWLERAGFASGLKLALQFYFRDMSVLKVMFTAIVVCMLGLSYFNWMGWIDCTQVYINPTYLWPQLAGGLVMGVGFVIGGYCPGTCLVATATGKIDGMAYTVGALAGMFVFAEVFDWLEGFWRSGSMGTVLVPEQLGVPRAYVVVAVVIMALLLFWGAERLERRFAK